MPSFNTISVSTPAGTLVAVAQRFPMIAADYYDITSKLPEKTFKNSMIT